MPPLDYVVEQMLIGVSTGAIYAIIAIGYNLVFGVMNVLNLTHGAIMMVGSFGVLLLYYLGVRDFWLASAFHWDRFFQAIYSIGIASSSMELGVNQAGADCVYSYSFCGYFFGQAYGHGIYGGFGGSIVYVFSGAT